MIRTKGANRARKFGVPSLFRGGILTLLLRPAGKSTTGFDTARLFLGSEGTLGVGLFRRTSRNASDGHTPVPGRSLPN